VEKVVHPLNWFRLFAQTFPFNSELEMPSFRVFVCLQKKEFAVAACQEKARSSCPENDNYCRVTNMRLCQIGKLDRPDFFLKKLAHI
jgi:hypothetical protein